MKRSGILLLLAVSFIARLLVAALIELNNDEVYYWIMHSICSGIILTIYQALQY
jgi:hypothetical protein